MSISVIVAAVIALLVLVVLALIFVDRIRGVNDEIGACENKGGTCYSDLEGCPSGTATQRQFSCGAERVCCIGVGSGS